MKTTDNQNEILDVVDENDNVIGQARRGEVHGNKYLIHRSVGVAVFNSRGELFLQQRSATKDTDPLCWTISCTGHVGIAAPVPCVSQSRSLVASRNRVSLLHNRTSRSQGEARFGISRSGHPLELVYEEAAARELEEELGVRNLKLSPVVKYICRAPNETEMQMLFKTTFDGPFRLHPEEIAQGKFFTRKELNALVKQEKIELSFMGKVALEKLGWW